MARASLRLGPQETVALTRGLPHGDQDAVASTASLLVGGVPSTTLDVGYQKVLWNLVDPPGAVSRVFHGQILATGTP